MNAQFMATMTQIPMDIHQQEAKHEWEIRYLNHERDERELDSFISGSKYTLC